MCVKAEGKAPEQLSSDDFFDTQIKNDIFDENFYGDEDFELDELDEEGFSDINFGGEDNEL